MKPYASIALFLVGVVFVLYWPVRHGEFVFDDVKLVAENRELWEARGFDFFVFESREDAPVRTNFRPIRFVSYKVDAMLTELGYAFGWFDEITDGPVRQNPFFFHLQNIFWHAINTLLVALIVRLLLPRAAAWIPVVAALAFAVHPIQTESVAYVSGRRDVLFLFFYLGAIAFYLWRRPRIEISTTCVLAVLFVLALLTKEMAFSLPLALLVAEYLAPEPVDGRPARPLWATVVAMYAVGGALVVGLLATAAPGGDAGHWGGSLSTAIAGTLRAIQHYVGLFAWPATLTIDYSYSAFPASRGWFDPIAGVSALALFVALIAVAARSFFSGSRWLAGGIFLFLVTLGPVSQLIPHPERVAERFLYLPILGLIIVAGALLAPVYRRWERPTLGAFIVLLVVWCGVTANRLDDWSTRESLWSSAVAAHPECARAQFALGEALRRGGRGGEALVHFSKAVELLEPIPDRSKLQHGYYLQALKLRSQVLARSAKKEDLEAARADLRHLLQQTDTDGRAVADDPRQQMELMKLEIRLGESVRARDVARTLVALPDEAFTRVDSEWLRIEARLALAGFAAAASDEALCRQWLSRAEELASTDRQRARVSYDRGLHLRNAEKYREAADCFRLSYRLFVRAGEGGNDNRVTALYAEAECLDRLGDPVGAASVLEELLLVEPNHLPALLSLGDIAMRSRDTDRARACFARVLERRPGQPRAIEALRQLKVVEKLAEKPPESGIDPHRAIVLRKLADRMYRQGKLVEAIQALDEADSHAVGPDQRELRATLRLYRARIEVEREAYDEADRAYEEYFALGRPEEGNLTDWTAAVIEAADVKHRRGEPRRARSLLEREWDAGLRDARVAYRLGGLSLKLGERPAARKWYSEMLRFDKLEPDQRAQAEALVEVLASDPGSAPDSSAPEAEAESPDDASPDATSGTAGD